MPDTGWKFYFLPVRAHLNQVPFLVLIVKKKRGIYVKNFGILEFDENQSGYKFGKKQLLLFLIGIIAFALIILLPIPGLELAGRQTLAIIILCLFCYANSGVPNLFATFLMFALPIIMGLASFPAYMSGLGTSPLIMLTCLFVC